MWNRWHRPSSEQARRRINEHRSSAAITFEAFERVISSSSAISLANMGSSCSESKQSSAASLMFSPTRCCKSVSKTVTTREISRILRIHSLFISPHLCPYFSKVDLIASSNCGLFIAPVCIVGLPSLGIKSNDGIERIPKREANSGCLSTSTLYTSILPA